MNPSVARGWATVDMERATGELSGVLRPGAAFEPVARSAVLGARCLRGIAADGRHWIMVLEPDTEGRLAAFLARHGEGWAATWLAEETAGPPTAPAPSPGPLGPESLEPGGPPAGPFRLRVPPATIEA